MCCCVCVLECVYMVWANPIYWSCPFVLLTFRHRAFIVNDWCFCVNNILLAEPSVSYSYFSEPSFAYLDTSIYIKHPRSVFLPFKTKLTLAYLVIIYFWKLLQHPNKPQRCPRFTLSSNASDTVNGWPFQEINCQCSFSLFRLLFFPGHCGQNNLFTRCYWSLFT